MAFHHSLISYHLLLLLLAEALSLSVLSSIPDERSYSLPGCPSRCGNIIVPYPFGLREDCCRGGFKLACNDSSDPPKLLIDSPNAIQYSSADDKWTPFEVTNISLPRGEIHVNTIIGMNCDNAVAENVALTVGDLPYSFSHKKNKFTGIGCDAMVLFSNGTAEDSLRGCISTCNKASIIDDGTCSGSGCCQMAIPTDLKAILIVAGVIGVTNYTSCSFASLVDENRYKFSKADLRNFGRRSTVPTTLDWAIEGGTCSAAFKSKKTANYVCGNNTKCVDSTNGAGYRCLCSDGYDGNPYLPDGCTDIDECKHSSTNNCSHICENTPGSYKCSCPSGTYGDGRKNGKGCITKNKRIPLLKLLLGIGLSILFLLVGGSWLYWILKKRRILITRQKFFEQNGGLFLKQQLSSDTDVAQMLTIFNSDDLKKATNNYHQSRILGKGGQGIVYKGVLTNGRDVAIKTSRLLDQSQDRLQLFVNEMMVLSRTIHRSIVRLIGCCLETEIPMLVYEFIPRGALSNYIYNGNNTLQDPSSLSWKGRLKIAKETAEAIDHLHTAGSMPIIHGDIKSANILLDNHFNAKVSDFGISKFLTSEETQINTVVQGTLGYLDPGYFQTGLLNVKSDVYSFGVILVELLTGQKPINYERPEGQRNLANYFLTAMDEDHSFEIFDPSITSETNVEQLQVVAKLAKDCLNLKADERPIMKEIALELGKLIRTEDAVNKPFIVHEYEEDVKSYDERIEANTTQKFPGETSGSLADIVLER